MTVTADKPNVLHEAGVMRSRSRRYPWVGYCVCPHHFVAQVDQAAAQESVDEHIQAVLR